jgi:hypothetical protein
MGHGRSSNFLVETQWLKLILVSLVNMVANLELVRLGGYTHSLLCNALHYKDKAGSRGTAMSHLLHFLSPCSDLVIYFFFNDSGGVRTPRYNSGKSVIFP